jgi:hypothetical protein
LQFLGIIVDSAVSYGVEPRSYQEPALPVELCGSPVLYGGGGRIRTHVARQGGRFTVCSD